jgi:4a-hydroxytetrahydrobiopterin dehydratase
MPALSATQIKEQQKEVPAWSRRSQTIARTFAFKDFTGSVDFVNQIARKANQLNHHPDIDIRYSKVTLKLTTHDEGGLTENDFILARHADRIFAKGK